MVIDRECKLVSSPDLNVCFSLVWGSLSPVGLDFGKIIRFLVLRIFEEDSVYLFWCSLMLQSLIILALQVNSDFVVGYVSHSIWETRSGIS